MKKCEFLRKNAKICKKSRVFFKILQENAMKCEILQMKFRKFCVIHYCNASVGLGHFLKFCYHNFHDFIVNSGYERVGEPDRGVVFSASHFLEKLTRLDLFYYFGKNQDDSVSICILTELPKSFLCSFGHQATMEQL